MALIALESFTDNPIFTRELRRRMRGKVMMYMTNAFIAAMCLVTTFMLVSHAFINQTQASAKIGTTLFETITSIQALLVLCIAPMITAGMATVERERKTFEFLKVTTLSPFTFIVGGLLSTMLYVLLVLLCALPLISISFLYGGVSRGQIVLSFAQLLGASLLLSAAGLWISSTRERTKSAQGATLFLVVGALLVGLKLKSNLSLSSSGSGTTFFGAPAPVWAIFSVTVVFFSTFLLLIAARKLYSPENRPLAYRHTLILVAGLCAGWFGLNWQEATVDQGRLWVWISYPMLFMLISTHCLHQLEVGNEAWKLKKRFKPLRLVDESVLFAALISVGWAAGTVWWGFAQTPGSQAGPSLAQLDPALLWLICLSMASSLIFVSVVSRFWAHYAPNRTEAFKKTMVTAAIAFLALPLVGWFMLYNTGDQNPLYAALFMASPLGAELCFYYADNQIPTLTVGGGDLQSTVAMQGLFLASVAYLAVSTILGVYHWRRFIRTRPPVDYSYAIS